MLRAAGVGWKHAIWSGMLFSALATHILIDILQVIQIPEETQKAASMYFRVTRMWPIALVNAITLATGNYAYLYLSVSIIQVGLMHLRVEWHKGQPCNMQQPTHLKPSPRPHQSNQRNASPCRSPKHSTLQFKLQPGNCCEDITLILGDRLHNQPRTVIVTQRGLIWHDLLRSAPCHGDDRTLWRHSWV